VLLLLVRRGGQPLDRAAHGRSGQAWCRRGSGGIKTGNERATILAKTLDAATDKLLDNKKLPSRKTGELDNRGSQFYLAMYWAQELAAQTDDPELREHFAPLAEALIENQDVIVAELTEAQGEAVEIGGRYAAESDMTAAVMRPSKTFNAALTAAQG
jgi:isocitrate dehydrogenase